MLIKNRQADVLKTSLWRYYARSKNSGGFHNNASRISSLQFTFQIIAGLFTDTLLLLLSNMFIGFLPEITPNFAKNNPSHSYGCFDSECFWFIHLTKVLNGTLFKVSKGIFWLPTPRLPDCYTHSS